MNQVTEPNDEWLHQMKVYEIECEILARGITSVSGTKPVLLSKVAEVEVSLFYKFYQVCKIFIFLN